MRPLSQRARRLISVGATVGGIAGGMLWIAVTGSVLLQGGAAAEYSRSEAWIELGIGVLLLSGGLFELFSRRWKAAPPSKL